MSSDRCDVLLVRFDVIWLVWRSVSSIWCHLTGATFCYFDLMSHDQCDVLLVRSDVCWLVRRSVGSISCHLTGVTFCFWIWCHLVDPFSDTGKPCPTLCLHEHLKLFNYFPNPSKTRPKDDFVLWKGRNSLFQSRLKVSSENLLAYFLRISLWNPLLSLRSRQIAKLLHINCLYRYLNQAEQKTFKRKVPFRSLYLGSFGSDCKASRKTIILPPSTSLSLPPPSLPTSFFVLRTSCTPWSSYRRRIEMENFWRGGKGSRRKRRKERERELVS